MTLPPHYATCSQYLEEVLAFLKQHQWIYNYPNTHILVQKIFDKVPSDWTNHLNHVKIQHLNKLALREIDGDAPQTLKDFICKVNRFTPNHNVFRKPEDIKFPHNASVGLKKKHEIISLAPLINNVCDKMDIQMIIDIGAGLGYLSQLLFDKYGYKVIGIEGCKEKFRLAQKHQEKYHTNSKESVKYREHFITEGSADHLEQIVKESFPYVQERKDNVCIIGLHACADLSVTILDIFLEIDIAKSLVIMPCCYHRLQMRTCADSSEEFVHFPISRALTDISKKLEGDIFLTLPFLRLATQQASAMWRSMSELNHEIHAKNCLFRAILQEVAAEENCRIIRLKRKSGKPTNSATYDIQSFLDNLSTSHAFITKDDVSLDEGILKKKIFEKWHEYKPSLNLIEALTAFQASIQGICENVVLLDRVEYLRDKGLNSCVYKVTDDCVSPRCFALVASK